ncbi:MAG: PilZ domain-containing protein [Desulfosarcinaceae bacterium]|nr:PilZ domain-containing protein [Desulfosarcinaceae bacterium]
MKTLLFIEPKPHVSKNFVQLLSNQQAFLKVLTVRDMVEAIDALERIRIDIVLTGDRFTEREVKLLAQQLRERPGTKLITLGLSTPKIRELVKACDVKIHLEAPVDTTLLLNNLLGDLEIDYGGQLRGIGLSSFLQMVELEGRSCTLSIISARRQGALFFDTGVLIGAKTDQLGGKAAALAILSWNDPLITIEYGEVTEARTIDTPLMSLLLESGRLQDEGEEDPHHEKRRHKRYECDLPTEFEVDQWTYTGTIRDISLGGALIETSEPVGVKQKIRLSLVSQSLERTCHIQGHIAHRTANGIGIAFEVNNMTQRNLLRIIISEVAGA